MRKKTLTEAQMENIKMRSTNLESCPCGGKAVWFETNDDAYKYQITCIKCLCGTDACISEDEAIRRWNVFARPKDNKKDKIYALVEITKEMKNARKNCGEDSNCAKCPCKIGDDDCVFNHVVVD